MVKFIASAKKQQQKNKHDNYTNNNKKTNANLAKNES